LAEQDDAVGELQRLIDVVGDEEHGSGLGGMHVEEQVLHLQSGEGVERAERLVEEEHAGVPGERARE
jgi:hypothetical protein